MTTGEPPADRSDEDPDLGEPIAALRDLSVGVGDRFERGIRVRIERRLLARDSIDLAWAAPRLVVTELLGMLFSLVGGRRAR